MIKTLIDNVEVNITPELIARYDQPIPRYTSYPTAPAWSEAEGDELYKSALLRVAHKSARQAISVYVHLPFCEKHCTFCGCHVIATKKREVIDPYLANLKCELELLSATLGKKIAARQLHWGGGTPTYLDEAQLRQLMQMLREHFEFTADAEVSVEADPRWTDSAKLKVLREIGFNRVSFGVQDVDEAVQVAAGRVQSFALTQACLQAARALKFESVNIDLIYGLPLQTPQSWNKTLEAVLTLNPDRIALFSFAYVPWLKPHMRSMDPLTLPLANVKLQLFAQAIQQLSAAGYQFIGLDHFAKHDDEMARAHREKTLHRNFQGYSTQAGLDLIGLGVSSIGFVDGVYAQNEKKLTVYERNLREGRLCTERICVLRPDDHLRSWVISRIFCRQLVDKTEFAQVWSTSFDEYFAAAKATLQQLEQDGLIAQSKNALQVTSLGRFFIRNVAASFDAYLAAGQGKFSRAV